MSHLSTLTHRLHLPPPLETLTLQFRHPPIPRVVYLRFSGSYSLPLLTFPSVTPSTRDCRRRLLLLGLSYRLLTVSSHHPPHQSPVPEGLFDPKNSFPPLNRQSSLLLVLSVGKVGIRDTIHHAPSLLCRWRTLPRSLRPKSKVNLDGGPKTRSSTSFVSLSPSPTTPKPSTVWTSKPPM